MTNVKVGITLPENFLASAAHGIYDFFMIANSFVDLNDRVFECHFIQTAAIQIPFFAKTNFDAVSICKQRNYDIIILPPILGTIEGSFKNNRLKNWLIRQKESGALLCSICAGSFILAEFGFLEKKRATTHWNLLEKFQAQYPNVFVERSSILVAEDDIVTAGGISSYNDLCYYICSKYLSPDIARQCAKLLLFDPGRNSQSPYESLVKENIYRDELIENLQKWLMINYHRIISVNDMAKKVMLGERTFMRKFSNVAGTSPAKYLQNIRLEEAKTSLINSSLSFEQITYNVGFDNPSSFHKLFKKSTSVTPIEFRFKFQKRP